MTNNRKKKAALSPEIKTKPLSTGKNNIIKYNSNFFFSFNTNKANNKGNNLDK